VVVGTAQIDLSVDTTVDLTGDACVHMKLSLSLAICCKCQGEESSLDKVEGGCKLLLYLLAEN